MSQTTWISIGVVVLVMVYLHLRKQAKNQRKRDQISLYFNGIKPTLERYGFVLEVGTESPDFVEAVYVLSQITPDLAKSGFPSLPDYFDPIIEKRISEYEATGEGDYWSGPQRPEHYYTISAQVTIVDDGNAFDLSLDLKEQGKELWKDLLVIHTPSWWVNVPNLEGVVALMDSVMRTEESRRKLGEKMHHHRGVYGASSDKIRASLPYFEVPLDDSIRQSAKKWLKYMDRYPN